MPRPKKQNKDTEPKSNSELFEILWDLHNHEDKADELMVYLEKIPENTKPHNFCKSYTIALFQEYITDENDSEMMLAACGLLKGFKFKPQKLDFRMQKYREHAREYNDFFKKEVAPNSFSTGYRNELRRITETLEKKLAKQLQHNGGKLNFIERVPNKLKYPESRYNVHNRKKNKNRRKRKFLGAIKNLALFAQIVLALIQICNSISSTGHQNIDSKSDIQEERIEKIIVHEDKDKIFLAPNAPSRHLNIELEPDNASYNAIEYTSSNSDAIIVKGRYIFLAPNWLKAKNKVSEITIKAKGGAEEKIKVTAQETAIDNSSTEPYGDLEKEYSDTGVDKPDENIY